MIKLIYYFLFAISSLMNKILNLLIIINADMNAINIISISKITFDCLSSLNNLEIFASVYLTSITVTPPSSEIIVP